MEIRGERGKKVLRRERRKKEERWEKKIKIIPKAKAKNPVQRLDEYIIYKY